MDDRSEQELSWYFTQRDGDLGKRASGYESNGVTVWDDARIHRAHMAKRSPWHRKVMKKEDEISDTVNELSLEHWVIARAAFATSAQWSQPLRSAFSWKERSWPLVGVALLMPATVTLFAEQVPDRQCRGSHDLLRCLELTVHTYSRKLQPVQHQSRDAYQAVVDAYDVLRVAREREARQQRNSYIAGLRLCLRGAA